MSVSKVVPKIVIHPERCTGCQICQLMCSLSKLKTFNPSEANIVIDWVNDEPSISFTDNCDECGICARYCLYGALISVK